MNIKKTSLLIVGAIWLLVGIGLSIAGVRWLFQLDFGIKLVIFVLSAFLIGLLKGNFVLKKVALKYCKRSSEIKFTNVLTGWAKIFGIKGFILIGVMMAGGSMLRHSTINRPILGIIYLAIGIGLVYASKIFFSNQESIAIQKGA